MKEIIEIIQKEANVVYKKNYSKNYIQLKILPIINHIYLSKNIDVLKIALIWTSFF